MTATSTARVPAPTVDLTRNALITRCMDRLDDLPPLLGAAPKTRRALAIGTVLDAAWAELVGHVASADTDRLRALVGDVVAAAFTSPAPEWLTDDLWGRLVAETPNPGRPRPASAVEGDALGHGTPGLFDLPGGAG